MNASEKCTRTDILRIILEASEAQGELLNKNNTELGGSDGSFTSQKNSLLQKRICSGLPNAFWYIPVGLFDLQIPFQ